MASVTERVFGTIGDAEVREFTITNGVGASIAVMEACGDVRIPS